MKKYFLLILLTTLPSLALASYSCNNKSVAREGDTSSDVKIKCGAPMNVESVGEVEIGGKTVSVERWTYNPGYGKFYQILEFQKGVLISVKNGPRVQ
jgi:hypothetical protein